MVREANVKQATAEKQLKEAQGKVGSYFTTYVNPSLKSVSAIHLFFLFPPLSDWCATGRSDRAKDARVDLHPVFP